jgi:hypothetical protein
MSFSQEQAFQQEPLVLHYDKRRFDGGSEKELIQYLESQQGALMASTLDSSTDWSFYNDYNKLYQAACVDHDVASAIQSVKAPVGKLGFAQRLKNALYALLEGPVTIVISLAGLMITCISVLTFKLANNQDMLDHCKEVNSVCRHTLGQGVQLCMASPLAAVRAMF